MRRPSVRSLIPSKMFRFKDNIFPSSCQVVPSISQDRREYTLCTPSPHLYYENNVNFSPIFAWQQTELEPLEESAFLVGGDTPPQSRTQVDPNNQDGLLLEDVNSELLLIEDRASHANSDASSLIIALSPQVAGTQSGETENETILDVLCAGEAQQEKHQSFGRAEKYENPEEISWTVDVSDSEKFVSEEDIFATGDDAGENNWLESL